MRIWSRATRNRPCGRCGAPILDGDPLLELQLRQPMRVPLVRCRACASVEFNEEPPEEILVPAPPPVDRVDLGPYPGRQRPPLPSRAHRRVWPVPFDWRERAAGD